MRVDVRGSPRDAGQFRGDKQAVRAVWPPGDREIVSKQAEEKAFIPPILRSRCVREGQIAFAGQAVGEAFATLVAKVLSGLA